MSTFIESNASIVTLTRGDTFSCPIFINQGTALEPVRYTLTTGDTMYFGIMQPNQLWENSIVKKIYTSTDTKTTDGDTIISLSSEDTEYLLPGLYYYSVKLLQVDSTTSAETVSTIVPITLFYIV